MLSLSDNNQADVFEAFNSTSRYLDGLLNFDDPYFEQMISQIYPTELRLNWTHAIHNKQDDFNFEIVNSPFLDRLKKWDTAWISCNNLHVWL